MTINSISSSCAQRKSPFPSFLCVWSGSHDWVPANGMRASVGCITFNPGHGGPCLPFSFLATPEAMYQEDILTIQKEPVVLSHHLEATQGNHLVSFGQCDERDVNCYYVNAAEILVLLTTAASVNCLVCPLSQRILLTRKHSFPIIIFLFLASLLEYNCFTMLC